MARGRMKPLPKLIMIVAAVGAIAWAFFHFGLIDKIAPSNASPVGADAVVHETSTSTPVVDTRPPAERRESLPEPLRVCVVTWPGYAGGQYFNGGFKASTSSRYFTEYGILVEFVLEDDFANSRKMWEAGQVDFLWITADSVMTEIGNLMSHDPKLVFQADWSRGGDVIMVNRGINSMSDLRGRRVAVAFGTPSHTFLLRMLEASGMSVRDINVVEMGSAIDAASAFKAGQVDAAVVWSPDDQDLLDAVSGSKVLSSTKDATHIIADVFYVKERVLQTRFSDVVALVEGWMRGAAELNQSPEAQRRFVPMLAAGLGQPADFIEAVLGNARWTTFGDNLQFFGLERGARVSGERLYNETAVLYANETTLLNDGYPRWREIVDTSVLQEIQRRGRLSGPEHRAEGAMTFDRPAPRLETAPAISVKRLSVSFQTNSAELDDNAMSLIDIGFVPTARAFAGTPIRIEGNTDSSGSDAINVPLSRRRAQAVADYLATEHGFDRNRFIVVGHGSRNPIPGASDRENRRTEFALVR